MEEHFQFRQRNVGSAVCRLDLDLGDAASDGGKTGGVLARQALPELTAAEDANGNTTSSAGITNLYDFENRMTGHGSLTLAYDGDGNRVSETIGGTTTKFLVDDENPTGLPQVLDELVSGSVTRTYAYGLQRISENQLVSGTWAPSFYGYDGHGNTRFLTSTSGTITDSYQYDAFGMSITSTGVTPNDFRYSGERLDANVGVYDLRARYYNHATGRLWAKDLVEGSACSPLSFNPYIYEYDDPVNKVDPTGEQTIVEYLLLRFYPSPLQISPPSLCPTWAKVKQVYPESLPRIFPKYRTGVGAMALIEVGPSNQNWDNRAVITESLSQGRATARRSGVTSALAQAVSRLAQAR